MANKIVVVVVVVVVVGLLLPSPVAESI